MSAGNFFNNGPRGARALMLLGFIGLVIRDSVTELVTTNNQSPQASQVTTVAIPASPTNDADYSVTVNGATATYTSDGSATQDEVGNGLVAAIQAKGGVRGIVSPSYTGGVLTLTVIFPGVSPVITTAGGSGGGAIGAATTATAAASADRIPFGRALVSDGYVTDEGTPKSFLPLTSRLTAQAMTFTITYAAGEVYQLDITVRGETHKIQVVGNTDDDTTAADLNTAINAKMPSYTVIATVSTNVVTLTAEVPGQGFEVAYGVQSGTVARMVKADTANGVLTDITRCLIGISARREDVENETIDGDDPSYKANENVETLQKGRITVQRDTTETIAPGDDIYIETATAATAGRFYKTGASATRIWLPRSFVSWERGERTGEAEGIQRLRLKAVA